MHRKCQNNKKTNKGQWKMNGKTSKTQITERIKNIKTNIKTNDENGREERILEQERKKKKSGGRRNRDKVGRDKAKKRKGDNRRK